MIRRDEKENDNSDAAEISIKNWRIDVVLGSPSSGNFYWSVLKYVRLEDIFS